MPAIVTRVSVSTTGMPKHAVLQAWVTPEGVDGDKPRLAKIHGGPMRAVCLYSEELYQWLREKNVHVQAGDLGENITTSGIDLDALKPGDRLKIGDCEIEITGVRVPCSQLKEWSPDLPQIIVGHSGWVAKVNRAAIVRPGDGVEVVSSG